MWINPITDFSIITKETPTEKLFVKWKLLYCRPTTLCAAVSPWVFNREVYVIFQSSDFIKYF